MRASGACAEECLALSSPSAQMQEFLIFKSCTGVGPKEWWGLKVVVKNSPPFFFKIIIAKRNPGKTRTGLSSLGKIN